MFFGGLLNLLKSKWVTSPIFFFFPFILCRRERDNSEAERTQHLKQIHDLQEHIQEKERQLLELQDQVCSSEC